MEAAIQCMRAAFQQLDDGNLIAPHRTLTNVEIGQLVFTAGASAVENLTGFRFYDLQQMDSKQREELTAVFSSEDGRLLGLVTGKQLGATRTGAIGGVALEHLAPTGANRLVPRPAFRGAGGLAADEASVLAVDLGAEVGED